MQRGHGLEIMHGTASAHFHAPRLAIWAVLLAFAGQSCVPAPASPTAPASPADADGGQLASADAVPDTAQPASDSAATSPETDLGAADTAGGVPACPTAKATAAEGDVVVAGTTLHLKGDGSAAANGAISAYSWTCTQPAGTNAQLLPSAKVANPTILLQVVGGYTCCLDVWDMSGAKSCAPACVAVGVTADTAIYTQLTWDTPADPDQTDKVGADLDLHFGHPLAQMPDQDCDGQPDPWFSNPFDNFWFNPQPDWGAAGPLNNPEMDWVDEDGLGPEYNKLKSPEGEPGAPIAYSIGVHYWNDAGFGHSAAKVSIYVQGNLVAQTQPVSLLPLDMWYVGKLNWPSAASGGAGKAWEPCWQSGASCKAGKNLMWAAAGAPCVTHCYVDPGLTVKAGGAALFPKCVP